MTDSNRCAEVGEVWRDLHRDTPVAPVLRLRIGVVETVQQKAWSPGDVAERARSLAVSSRPYAGGVVPAFSVGRSEF